MSERKFVDGNVDREMTIKARDEEKRAAEERKKEREEKSRLESLISPKAESYIMLNDSKIF